MAGSYPDIPAPRMAYDRDGSQVFIVTPTGGATQKAASEMKTMNGESLAGMASVTGGGGWMVMIFPELRDISAYCMADQFNGVTAIETSTNTTNGFDGTWTSLGTVSHAPVTLASIRSNIHTVSGAGTTGVKAIRFAQTSGLSGITFFFLHLYGTPSAGQNPNRLEFWHPTLNQSLNITPAYLDWGDRPRSTVLSRQVRLKNLSSSLTATSVVVGVEALTDTSPTMVSQYALSWDGTTFSPTLTISSLSPGQISAGIIVRQTLLSNAVLSLWTQRLYAQAGVWA